MIDAAQPSDIRRMLSCAKHLRHRAKLLVGRQIESVLSKQFMRGQGPAGRLIGAFSNEAKVVTPHTLNAIVEIKRS
jgi:hypothetical protein